MDLDTQKDEEIVQSADHNTRNNINVLSCCHLLHLLLKKKKKFHSQHPLSILTLYYRRDEDLQIQIVTVELKKEHLSEFSNVKHNLKTFALS